MEIIRMEIIREVEVISPQMRNVKRKVGRCICGEELLLYGFTNTCLCGRDYNMEGQLLAPRSQWGEETGESVEDILSVDY